MIERVIRVPCRAPYDWGAMLAFLRARAIDGVESVGDSLYRRTFRFEGRPGTLAVTHAPDHGRMILSVRFASEDSALDRACSDTAARVRRVLDPEADIGRIGAHLASDEALAPLVAQRPGLRVPGGWDGFELAVRAILGQQITVKAARQLAGQLTAAFGDVLTPEESDSGGSERESPSGPTRAFPRPERIAMADLSSIGLPRARAAALRALAAEALADPSLFQPKASLADSIARFRSLPGIGDWTAHYIALRALREPDAFPASDVGLLRGAAAALGEPVTPATLLARAERWRPWRAYAAQHLWMVISPGPRSAG